MTQPSFQDYYPDELAHCYGCGRLNEHGYQIKSYWDGDESVCHFMPKPYHISVPGYVYGGLLASLIDCHGTGTAAAALLNAAKEQDPNAEPNMRYAHCIFACGLSETNSIECGIGSPRQSQRAIRDAKSSSKSGSWQTELSPCAGSWLPCRSLSPCWMSY